MAKPTLFLLLLLITNLVFSQQKKSILLIVAHPDDENMVGPVLAKYARLGHTVNTIIATDGKYSPLATTIPAGDSLGKTRQLESICASEKLGINHPIFFSIDRMDTKNGVRPYLNGRKRFLEQLKNKLDSIKPDILITFGPEGEYGHSEHIVVGAAVTEVLLREDWVEKYPLYFLAWKKEQVTDDPDLSYVNENYIDLEISFSDEDARRSLEAGKCYVTQFTPEEMKDQEDHFEKDKYKMTPFRRFYAPKRKKVKKDFF
ncbi:MAG: PIG-L family deacetylase [Chitinophagaceae bacterium]|nr:PIG-L family deacetylase [Chitinophagaceae bacterium]